MYALGTSATAGVGTQRWGCSSDTTAPLPAAADTAVEEAGGCVRQRPRPFRRLSHRCPLTAALSSTRPGTP
ncbi:hypothetical protein BAE44_0025386 [Dichanthelium oligosanthes]|uniref:Uncharacterized protein n=1 Tax=Dichanthelium oligosanthes TaxID=888268 RepID=A0A1E5UL50_9POAL|nr:hypothetical protein BAE44_0025386 [Dichanthelium oligosanthes]